MQENQEQKRVEEQFPFADNNQNGTTASMEMQESTQPLNFNFDTSA